MKLIQNADIVYHLADVVGGVDFAFREEPFIFRHNILINTNVLSACIANHIPRYIYVGTACGFPKHIQITESFVFLEEDQTNPAHPESSYGWSKLMGEYEAELAQKAGKIDVGLLRLHNVYEPGAAYDTDGAQVIPSLIRKAILHPKESFIVWGSGNQYRDFVYIDDVIDALISGAMHGLNKGLIPIGSEQPTTIKEVAELIVRISGKPIELIFDSSKPEGDKGRAELCNRARQILSWQAKTPLREGLEKTYKWMLNQNLFQS